MTENTLHHDAWTVRDTHRRGYLGKFQAPGAGVNYVRDENGIVLIFPTQEQAYLEAHKAKDRALNAAPRSRPSTSKTFAVRRNGKNVRTISLPQG